MNRVQEASATEWEAWGSLALGAGFIPLAATFFALIVAGALLTPKKDHTRLGNALALFCGGVGTIFVSMCVLTISRWYDLDPSQPSPIIGITSRVVGIVGLLVALYAAHISAPIIISRIIHKRAGGTP